MISPARLAWLQLRRQKVRFAVALAGVAFAVVLMFMQLGFMDALFRSAVNVHGRARCRPRHRPARLQRPRRSRRASRGGGSSRRCGVARRRVRQPAPHRRGALEEPRHRRHA